MSNRLLVLLGPTAAGKTALAVSLAKQFDAEIISADSRQVFRGMDIGTGKDLKSYGLGDRQIPYHLINICEAGEKYHVNAFVNDFYTAFTDITKRNHLPLLCGGTGLYIHSVLQNHELTAVPVNMLLRNSLVGLSKPLLAEKLNSYPVAREMKVDFSSSKRLIRAIEIAAFLSENQLEKIERPIIEPVVIGLDGDVQMRRARILNRLSQRLDEGLIDEVSMLLQRGVSKDMLTFYGLEYKFIIAYLDGQLTYDEFKERLGIAICQFAKRQMTFFRKMEKDGVQIKWLSADQDFESVEKEAIDWCKHKFESN